MQIKVRKDGNMMRIFPLTRRLRTILQQELTYDRKKFMATAEERRKNGNRHVAVEEIPCYMVKKVADTLQLFTNTGYLPRLKKRLIKSGYELDIKDLRPIQRCVKRGKNPDGSDKLVSVYKPQWQQLTDVTFKPGQREMLEAILKSERAQVHYPTGAGKTWMITNLVRILPYARILISTRFQDPLKDLYRNIRRHSPNVGIYCASSKKNLTSRVMCISAGSLHQAYHWKPDFVICDESQELATDKTLEKLANFRHCRMLSLSANRDDRFDSVDFELEGLFGPVVATITYETAVSWGLIVPIEVHWRAVRLRSNPGEGWQGVMHKRKAIWANRGRNQLIAHDARRFENDQVLIVVKTVEHALNLKKLLPEFELCYAKMTAKQLRKFREMGLVSKHYRPITDGEREAMKKRFENGESRKVIATTVWNRGVNFHRLQVLIRADAGASRIDDTQIPGRLSRTCKAVDKTCGILIDYLDRFDETLERKSDSRRSQYKLKKWLDVRPGQSPLFRDPFPQAPQQSAPASNPPVSKKVPRRLVVLPPLPARSTSA